MVALPHSSGSCSSPEDRTVSAAELPAWTLKSIVVNAITWPRVRPAPAVSPRARTAQHDQCCHRLFTSANRHHNAVRTPWTFALPTSHKNTTSPIMSQTGPSIDMHSYSVRLDTFLLPHQLSKRRASAQTAKKKAGTVEWPHKLPAPEQVGNAHVSHLSDRVADERVSWRERAFSINRPSIRTTM